MESFGSDGLTAEERAEMSYGSGSGGGDEKFDEDDVLADLSAGLMSAWSWGRATASEVGTVVAVKGKQAASAMSSKVKREACWS